MRNGTDGRFNNCYLYVKDGKVCERRRPIRSFASNYRVLDKDGSIKKVVSHNIWRPDRVLYSRK